MLSETKVISNRDLNGGISKYTRNRTRTNQQSSALTSVSATNEQPKKEVPPSKPQPYDKESILRLSMVVTIDMEMGEENCLHLEDEDAKAGVCTKMEGITTLEK